MKNYFRFYFTKGLVVNKFIMTAELHVKENSNIILLK